jgi:1-acyl-sn-glycerol-3-phosphate acyltransferase
VTIETREASPVRRPSRSALAFYGVCRFISVGFSRFYWPGRVIGKANLPKDGAYVLAPVHRSNIDWLVVARVTRRRLRYLVKGEVWKVPALGRFIELLGAFAVHRDMPDREALNKAREVLEAGEPLVVFPEGTRGAGPMIGEIREGAAYLALRAGVPIVPVGMAGTEAAMPRGTRFPRPHRVSLVIGAPIEVGPSTDGDGARVRIARSRLRETSEALRDAMQLALSHAMAQLGATDESR